MERMIAAAIESFLSRGVTITDLGDGSVWVRLAPEHGTEHEKSNFEEPVEEPGRMRRSW